MVAKNPNIVKTSEPRCFKPPPFRIGTTKVDDKICSASGITSDKSMKARKGKSFSQKLNFWAEAHDSISGMKGSKQSWKELQSTVDKINHYRGCPICLYGINTQRGHIIVQNDVDASILHLSLSSPFCIFSPCFSNGRFQLMATWNWCFKGATNFYFLCPLC